MVAVKAGLTHTSGSSGRRGSVMANAMRVASTARSRSDVADSCTPATSRALRAGRNTTRASDDAGSGAPTSGSPSTQSTSRAAVAAVSRRAVTASPVTGWPCATRSNDSAGPADAWPPVSGRSSPVTSSSSASADHRSTATGSRAPGASSCARWLA